MSRQQSYLLGEEKRTALVHHYSVDVTSQSHFEGITLKELGIWKQKSVQARKNLEFYKLF